MKPAPSASGIFISVDTERDTPAITDAYARRFGPAMTGLSGSHEQVAAAVKRFNATYAITKSPDSYVVQHTTHIFLLDADGRFIDTFAMTTRPADVAAAIDALED